VVSPFAQQLVQQGGVSFMPRPMMAPAVQAVQRTRRTNAANPQRRQQQQPATPLDAFLAKAAATPTAQKRSQEVAQKAAEDAAWDEMPWYKKGLGMAIGNPVSKAILAPLETLSYPRRAIEFGVGHLATAMPEWTENLPPFMGLKWIDEAKVRNDDRSTWDQISDPDFGFGQIAKSTGNKLADRAVGFTGDVLLDPTTYLAGPTMRMVEGTRAAAKGAEATAALARSAKAAEGLTLAEKAVQASGSGVDDIARLAAESAAAQAERTSAQLAAEHAAERAAPGGLKAMHAETSKAGRLQILQDVGIAKGETWVQQHSDELARVANRGFGAARTAEVREALGLLEPSLRFAGVPLKGTRVPAKLAQEAGGLIRGAANNSKLLAPLARVPMGAEASYADLIGQGSGKGNTYLALADLAMKGTAKEGNEFNSAGQIALNKFYRTELKGKSKSAVEQMVRDAETAGVESPLNPLYKALAATYTRISGKNIEPFLRDPDTYVPHVMSQQFRRWLRKNSTDAKAVEFMDASGFKTIDTLEGSGFLERARAFDVKPGEAPKEFSLNGREFRLTDGTIDELNLRLNEVFPEFGGSYKFYETDPVLFTRDYIRSLSKGVGKEKALQRIGAAPDAGSVAAKVEGDLADALTGAQENLAAQNPVAQAVRAGYDPTDVGAPTRERPALFTSAEARAAVKPGEVDPATYFQGKVSPRARRELADDLTTAGKAYVKEAKADAAQEFDTLVERLKDGRQMLLDDLSQNAVRLTPDVASTKMAQQIKDTKAALKALRKARTVDHESLVKFLHGMDQQIALAEDQISTLTRVAREQQTSESQRVVKELRQGVTELRAQERAARRLTKDPTPLKEMIKVRTAKLRKGQITAENKLARAMKRKPPHSPEKVAAAIAAVDHISIFHDAPDHVERAMRRVVTEDQNYRWEITKAEGAVAEARQKLNEVLQAPAGPVDNLRGVSLPTKPGSEQEVLQQLVAMEQNPAKISRSATSKRAYAERTLPERSEMAKAERVASIAEARDVALEAPVERAGTLRAKRAIKLRDSSQRLRLMDDQIDTSMKQLHMDRQNLPGVKVREKKVTATLNAKEKLKSKVKFPRGRNLDDLQTGVVSPMEKFHEAEMKRVAEQNPLLSDKALNDTESLLTSVAETVSRQDFKDVNIAQVQGMIDDAYEGKLTRVMVAALNDGWKAMHPGNVERGDIILSAELAKRFEATYQIVNDPKLFGRTWNAATNLFKTYATLTPGFHTRNAMGGIFMNTSDGVALSKQLEGFQVWSQYMKGGDEWLAVQPQRIQDAITAATTSGAGGRFTEAGVGEAMDAERRIGRMYNFLADNRVTRRSQGAGTRVEGGLRLGMALDTIDQGGNVQNAYARIARIHFDYADVSKLDESAKRLVPFWTFMSRNLPLQITQMWTKPRTYQIYQNLARNFSAPDEEFTPDYWGDQGAWNTGLSPFGLPLYMAPDLGFNRVQNDLANIEEATQGEFGGLLSAATPFISAPAEYIFRKDLFTGKEYPEGEDFVEPGGILGIPQQVLATILQQTNEQGQIDPRFIAATAAINPLQERSQRLAPQITMGEGTQRDEAILRQPESWLRFFGGPVKTLTPQQQRSEALRRQYELRDEAKRRRQMAS